MPDTKTDQQDATATAKTDQKPARKSADLESAVRELCDAVEGLALAPVGEPHVSLTAEAMRHLNAAKAALGVAEGEAAGSGFQP